MRVPLIILLLVASLQGCGSMVPRGSSYRLVLAVDKAGVVQSGSKAELEQAVRAGRELHIGWALDWHDDGAVDIEHWAPATFITIYQGEIFAQQPMILQQKPRPDVADIALGGTGWVGLIATTGVLRGRFQAMEGDSDKDAVRVASWWYVRD